MCVENNRSDSGKTSEFAKCDRVIFEFADNDIIENELDEEGDPATSTYVEHKDSFLKIYSLIVSFDGGKKVAEYVAQFLPGEIIRNDIIENIKSTKNVNQEVADDVVGFPDEEIKSMLKSIYSRVDSQYFSTKIGDVLARRLSFDENQMDVHEDEKLKGGATAILGLIIGRTLFVANCGNSIAILIKEVGKDLMLFPVYQLHENHEVGEIERLHKLGIADPTKLKNPTRGFGDFFRKGGYKENEKLKEATSDPVIVEPTVVGGVNIDETFRFLLFASPTVVRAIHIIKPSANVNETLAEMIVNEIKRNQYDFKNMVVLHKNALFCARLRTLENAALNVLTEICYQYDGVLKSKVSHTRQPLTRDSMSLFFVPLCSNLVEKLGADNEVREQHILGQNSGDKDKKIDAYVDFSEFAASDQRDTILAKIESLKDKYSSRMKSIPEE